MTGNKPMVQQVVLDRVVTVTKSTGLGSKASPSVGLGGRGVGLPQYYPHEN